MGAGKGKRNDGSLGCSVHLSRGRLRSPRAQASPHLPPSSPALPSVLINIRTSVQSVVVGHAVEFECLALGDPKPQVTWSKVGGRLRPGIVQSGGIVRIARVELADAGQYRCTASNAAGTTQSHVLLLVQGEGWRGLGVLGRLLPALPSSSFPLARGDSAQCV